MINRRTCRLGVVAIFRFAITSTFLGGKEANADAKFNEFAVRSHTGLGAQKASVMDFFECGKSSAAFTNERNLSSPSTERLLDLRPNFSSSMTEANGWRRISLTLLLSIRILVNVTTNYE